MERAIGRLYEFQVVCIDGETTIGKLDAFRAFAERSSKLLSLSAFLGLVVPSAFHANEGATGIRQLFIDRMNLLTCFSFENRKQIFEIHRSFKFALIVARSGIGQDLTNCAFYLQEVDWLRQANQADRLLCYDRKFIERTGGRHLTLIELQSQLDLAIAEQVFLGSSFFGDTAESLSVRLGRELNMTDDAFRFVSVHGEGDPRDPDIANSLRDQGYIPLHEGKTFHQYTDRWEDRPRYLIPLDKVSDKRNWLRAAQFYRLGFRDIARSTDERTGIFAFFPPGVLFGNTAPCERQPERRPNVNSILISAVVDSYVFDWVLRLKSAAHVNLFILNGCPVPRLSAAAELVLVHCALRLTCNHAGYALLWEEQLGDAWREPTNSRKWPVLEGEAARWAVRAAIDAVVADAYGLSFDQYQHVLSSFSHKSYPKAPELCLAAFSELKQIGLDAFVRKHDPYWDIPLVRSLPQPVLTFPQLVDDGIQPDSGSDTSPPSKTDKPPAKRGRKPKVQEVTEPVLPLFANLASPPKTSSN